MHLPSSLLRIVGVPSHSLASLWLVVGSLAFAADVPPAPAAPAATFLDAIKQRYRLVWSDECDGDRVDPAKWTFEGSLVHRNGEKQVYADSMADGNIRFKDGKMILVAKKEDRDDAKGKTFHYTSAALDSVPRFRFGIVEARARLPKGQGVWPAFWMLGFDPEAGRIRWPHTGEIDILELWGGANAGDRQAKGALHYWNSARNCKTVSGGGINDLPPGRTYNDDFHTFGILWTEAAIVFYVDDTITTIVDVSSDEMHAFREYDACVLVNLAIGSSYYKVADDLPFPQEYAIDHVRVWQSAENPEAPSAAGEFLIFDAEKCEVAGTATTTSVKLWDLCYATVLSAEKASEGATVELRLPVVQNGRYRMYLISRDAPTRGAFQCAIDGVDTGAPVDFAHPLGMYNHAVGTVDADGTHATTVRLTCTRESAHALALDKVVLVKAPDAGGTPTLRPPHG